MVGRGALLAVALASCGGGENADEFANTHMGADAADAKLAALSMTGQATLDGSKAEDALLNSIDASGPIDAPGPVDAPAEMDSAVADVSPYDAPPMDAGDASSGSDACSNDVCGSIIIGGNVCPVLTGFTINPVVVGVGEDVHLTSSATDGNGDPLVFHWTSTQGSFVDANAANTTFRCSMPGTATLSLTVSDGRCDDGFDQDIHCN